MKKWGSYKYYWRILKAILRGQAFIIPYRYRSDNIPLAQYDRIEAHFKKSAELERHLVLLSSYAEDLDRIEGDASAPEPRWNQDWFPALDASAYYTMIRLYRPSRIVEIGAGHSTRFALRAIKDGALDTHLHVIDPVPRADLDRSNNQLSWHAHKLEEIDPAFWESLASGDILFIDSSHILMPGTDLDYLLNVILPVLPKNMLVHFHDIFLPKAYPKEWHWRGYNEQQAIAGLLFNPQWSVLFSSRYALSSGLAGRIVPKILESADHGLASSLWLRKEE